MTASLLAQASQTPSAGASGLGTTSTIEWWSSPIIWGTLLLTIGIWLSLPRGARRGRRPGLLLTVVALGVFASQLRAIAGWLDQGLFACFAAVTVVACLAAITARNPVYAAIWFGLALVGTAALFLLQGAQFLGVATVAVYAGAILVTFLFVIMLARPRGQAYYDRVSWEAFLSAAAGAVLVGLLIGTVQRAAGPQSQLAAAPAPIALVQREDAAVHGVLADAHVAQFGWELLGRHLISMQAAGALMLAALVGAVAIVAQGGQLQPNVVVTADPQLARSRGDVVGSRQIAWPPATPEASGGTHA